MKDLLYDNHGRIINYLRLAVTDRCNLRCAYCMPEAGLQWLSRDELMTYEEMLRLCSLLVAMGIGKIRITGGEPFVRKGMMGFLAALARIPGLGQLTLTTNGVRTAPLVPELKKIGIHSVNLSLDTLDRNRFFSITCRDELPQVMATLEQLLQHDIKVRINAVVMEDKNIADIVPLAQLAHDLPVQVRFIEEMPFNGQGEHKALRWDHVRIRERLQEAFPSLRKLEDEPFATSANYQVAGHRGQLGIIAAYTRSFCGTCNRLRITPQGDLKTCLYGGRVLNLRDLARSGAGDGDLQAALMQALSHRAKNGWEAEHDSRGKEQIFTSMAAIGG